MLEVNSYSDFLMKVYGKGKAYLLLYKKGNEKNDCAFSNVRAGSENIKNSNIYHADVTSINDIHERFNISTAPVLLEFRKGQLINAIKGSTMLFSIRHCLKMFCLKLKEKRWRNR